MELAYLACPYANKDSKVEAKRLAEVTKFAAKLMKNGIHVFSPLTHNAPLVKYGLGRSWNFWLNYDLFVLSKCEKIIVLQLDGWEKSVGVRAEIKKAKQLKIPIIYIKEITRQWLD